VKRTCNKVERVRTDVDESENWHCVKTYGHADCHYVENADGSSGMAVALTPEEAAYQKGLVDGAERPRAVLVRTAEWLQRRAATLRKEAAALEKAAAQIRRGLGEP
jgi:hypothetical protein